ncbi:tetratricopeptide repeat protein 28-like [Montipora foliosa]|uniref:tetratricopeptide repeat protein 28-like n=1 Tax=Montipora foliosa TaxID=591990 RepID=UPI0035F1A173
MAGKKMSVFEQYIQELSVARKEGNRKGEGIAYFNLGDYYYGLAYFEQAKRNCTEALSIFKEIGFSAGERKACCNLGRAYHSLGNFKKARKYLKQHLSIAKKAGDRAEEGIANGNLSNAYSSLGNFKQAIEFDKKHLSIAKEVGDTAGEGKAYCNLGNAYHSLGNFKQAIEYRKQHLSIAKEVGDKAMKGKAYCNLGNSYNSLGNFKQAIEYHEQHLSIAKEVGDRDLEGKAYSNLGNDYYRLGNFKQAIEYHEQGLSIAKEVEDRAGEGAAYCNLGTTYNRLGNFKQAIECHEQELSIAKEVRDRALEGKAYCNLGGAYHSLSNFKQAIEYNKQGLSIAKEVGDTAGEGNAYCNLGNHYFSLGNFVQAMEYHKQYLSIKKEAGDMAGEGKAYGNLGNDYLSLGNFKQAIDCCKQYLIIAKKVGDTAGEGKANGNLGNAYYSLGNFEQAIEYHKEHLRIAKEIGNRPGEAKACGNLGGAYFRRGELEKALLFNEQYLTISNEIRDPVMQGIASHNLGLIHESSASLCKAINFYRLSIKHFNETRRLLHAEDAWKIGFRDTNQNAYTALWRALLNNGEIVEALYAAEQGRAQALTDILKVQFGVHEEPSSAKETISAVMKYLPLQTVFIAVAENTISFWLLRRGSGINYRQKKIENGSADSLIKTTLKEIGAGAVVRCENRSLHRDHSDFSCSGEAVKESFQSLSVSDSPLKSLHDVLISPIADLLHGGDLIFVPDGPFSLAPYSALSDSLMIRTVPSLTALKVISSAADHFNSKSEALLVGDPCLKEITWGTGGPMFKQLPCARKEVEMIGELLQTAPLTGENATKAEVLKRMKSVALIHVAAHGDDYFGEIVLAPNHDRSSQIPEEKDYMLTMSDVQAVRLQAKLVVLSSCHSGQGEVKSEGVVGIARAFLCAGAKSVLVSLWAIDDEATLLFMKSFYQHLADRKSASLALHHAMKSLRETKEYSAIKYWAPFVLIGDDVTFEFGPQELEKNETFES